MAKKKRKAKQSAVKKVVSDDTSSPNHKSEVRIIPDLSEVPLTNREIRKYLKLAIAMHREESTELIEALVDAAFGTD